MNNIEMGALATAGFGGLTAFWGQVQGFWIRLRSFFFIEADLSGWAGEHFIEYCWRNYKMLNLGNRHFVSFNAYIIPEKSHGFIFHEKSGQSLTFFKGWKPLLVSVAGGPGEGGNHIKVSFIRGTFDLEKMLFACAKEVNKLKRQGTKTTRFRVKKIFGRGQDRSDGKDYSNSKPSGGETAQSDSNQSGSRIIGWKPEDIGAPTVEQPFETLAYDQHVEDFKQEVTRWKGSEDWFRSKKLPWRFGAGLYGPPGTGKSSFIRAMAQELDVPVHIYDLTAMSNRELSEHWSDTLSESPCMVVFEDIDRVFDKDKNVKGSEKKDPLTLDCLLNCISGVQAAEGILVLVTANDITKVDPALGVPDENGDSTRPGRLDRAVYFGPSSEKSRRIIAKRILSDCIEIIEETVTAGEGETGAQFESRCSKIALAKYWGGFKAYGK